MEIDRSRLECLMVDNEFDSFYDLAVYLGCKYNKTATNSIKAVKKEFDRYFTWERIGKSRRVRVTGFHEIIKVKVTNYGDCDIKNALIATGILKANSNRKYIKSAEVVHDEDAKKFIEAMQSTIHRIEKIVITHKDLFKELDMEIVDNLPEDVLDSLSSSDLTSAKIKRAAKDTLYARLKSILQNSLSSLKNKHLLEYYPGDIIQYRAEWILPSKEQQRWLNEAKETACKNLNVMNTRQAYKEGKFQKYKKSTIKALPAGSFIVDFKPAFLIVFTPEQLRRYIIDTLGIVPEVEDAKQMLFSLMKHLLDEADRKNYSSLMKGDGVYREDAIAPEHKELCYDYLLQ